MNRDRLLRAFGRMLVRSLADQQARRRSLSPRSSWRLASRPSPYCWKASTARHKLNAAQAANAGQSKIMNAIVAYYMAKPYPSVPAPLALPCPDTTAVVPTGHGIGDLRARLEQNYIGVLPLD